MPTRTTTRWVDTLIQRVDRIRRAHNLCELQRAGYMLIAVGVAAATTLLVTGLFGGARLFAVSAWSTVAALPVTTVLLIRETLGRRLDRERAVRWIEDRARLSGRLRSLVELDARGDEAGTRFLLPLLTAENARALPSWEPSRIVRRRVPRVALALALASVCVLLAALTLTPVLYPRVPLLVDADATPAGSTPETARGAGENLGTPLASIPAALQERIRQTVWGDAWERVREAIAHASGRDAHRAPGTPPAGPRADEDEDGSWQLAERATPGGGTRNDRPGGAGQATNDEASVAAAPRRARQPSESETAHTGSAGAGGGAGSSTSPDLYGAATPPDRASRARFELGLVTRMRLKLDPGALQDAGPARARDRQPILAVSARREELAHEMAIPRAYEPIVRQVFAHRDVERVE